jgi:carboxylesterase
VPALHSLVELAESVHSRLSEIHCPTLVLHARDDHTAPFECSEVIAAGVSTDYIRHRAFEGSYHLLSLDYERNIVAAEVAAFFEHHFSRSETDEVRRLD